MTTQADPLQNVAINFNLRFPLPDGRTLVQGPLSYNSDGLATVHNADFLNDPLFAEAYQLGINTGPKFRANLKIQWGVFVYWWAGYQARSLRGDYVECGVNTGIYSRAIMHYVDFVRMAPRKFYLLDTWCGIPLEQLTEGE